MSHNVVDLRSQPLRQQRTERDVLATAEHILIECRGYSGDAAFDELMDVARRHHVDVRRAAERLIDLAATDSRAVAEASRLHGAETAALDETWAPMLANRHAS
ncbi:MULTISPECIES: ANTAR domain-containing protein [Rhodococcus]|uniref:ANTAR domain-containing protein n=1 Tax=Rhodococcus oxybenzonivorans TaxID=1990687 RepID=A0AAE4V1M9_9NOCA|nr:MULTISPECIES: ANTAR domain-containing protein [Rhodococcus]MDV7240886.1 ANTAR domain-containing protein [Rhodococcus oxybenzonivorans]MDV7266717.1 ANTAR domain-containing protein [Rhodococcus oxybenzonivorans]MDV7273159.1 ANTAR domain-containing protein [Rhodococcus oxybenzonivorans]MDV7333103.1 ANTAR domain-containing protein [Rhodococcus oxybenzonivorans]MDV7342269.1 ANTAR domain-containing protein [Rhodococcus oxybenzonivorans]